MLTRGFPYHTTYHLLQGVPRPRRPRVPHRRLRQRVPWPEARPLSPHFAQDTATCNALTCHDPASTVRENRQLMTGMHVVCDVKCSACETVLGWKYEAASEESQQYKIGKFILERGKIAKAAGW